VTFLTDALNSNDISHRLLDMVIRYTAGDAMGHSAGRCIWLCGGLAVLIAIATLPLAAGSPDLTHYSKTSTNFNQEHADPRDLKITHPSFEEYIPKWD